MSDSLDESVAESGELPVGKYIGIGVLVIAIALGWKYFHSQTSALVGWSNDWNAAVAQSKQSGKPAVVLFTADWCPPCRQFKSEVLSRADVKKYLAENHTPVVIDVSDRSGPNNQRAAEFGVSGIPTLILYDRRGNEVARSFGMPAEAFLAWLRSDGRGMQFSRN